MILLLALGLSGCTKRAPVPASPAGSANAGAVLVEISGGKQATRIGAALEQPVVLQVNDAQGAAVAGAMVTLSGAKGVKFDPASGATDSSGQLSAQVWAPGASGHFQIVALTNAEKVHLKIDQVGLGYEQLLGRQLSVQYCARCHDPESTPERVSNMDNLDPKPHAFTEGDTYNKIGAADLISLIGHGGAALNKSASMPPYGHTLSPADIEALSSYIRAIADPPYPRVYANK